MDMKQVWNTRYGEEGYAYGTNPNDFLVSQYQKIKPQGKVLCIAEGEGRNAIFLAHKGFQVAAVDFSEIGILKIKERSLAEGLTIETVVSDLAVFEMGHEKWDAIISIFAHLPPDVCQTVHSKVQKALKPGGLLILEAYRPEQLSYGTGGPPSAEMMMSSKKLNEQLAALKAEISIELLREIHEGKYHNGTSAVVQYVGRK